MSKLLFLPDRNGREKESDGAGLVRLSADTSEMAALAKRMVIRQETDEITPDAAYQGAMALALLLDSWQGTDVRLAVRTIDAQKSRFASWVMAARPMEQRNQPIRLLMLVKDQQEALLGLVDAENGLTLAAQTVSYTHLTLPAAAAQRGGLRPAAPPPAPDESAGRPREVLPGGAESAADAGARNALP